MRLKPGVTKETRQAVQSFHDYATHCSGGAAQALRQFCRARSVDAQTLVETFDAMHPGLNHFPARKLTRATAKVRIVLENVQETEGVWRGWIQWTRRHKLSLAVVVPVLILPMLLSPTRPIAVYGFLVDSYHPSLTPEAFASTGTDLTAFLTSPVQVRRYKTDLREDMLDTRGGKLFVIVRCPDGTLRQEAIRTWNGFLRVNLPSTLCTWLDRKEVPYLGDKVDTWLRGNEIIAMGHYHAFGGPPSTGDNAAQYFSDLPEIVVVNGIVPMIYLDGNVVSYGDGVIVAEDLFRSLRTLELSLMMDVTQGFSFSTKPSPALRSFLGFLQNYRNVDISRNDRVARGIQQLCVELKNDYQTVFTKGFFPTPYKDDPDSYNFLWKLTNLHAWADKYGWSRLDATDPPAGSGESPGAPTNEWRQRDKTVAGEFQAAEEILIDERRCPLGAEDREDPE